jgi:hypothetical protein
MSEYLPFKVIFDWEKATLDGGMCWYDLMWWWRLMPVDERTTTAMSGLVMVIAMALCFLMVGLLIFIILLLKT